MAWFIGQSLLVVLAAFLLGVLTGWLVWGRRKTSPSSGEAVSTAAPEKPKRDDDIVVPAPAAVPAARVVEAVEPDDIVDDDLGTSTGSIATAPADVPPGRAATPSAPDGDADDLERIEGIGPKFAAALRAAGIHTFRQLAETDDATRRAAIEAAGLTFAPSLVTWGRQARLLADGDEEAFLELTKRLIAGRDTGSDDELERIEGIGPKFAAALRAAGIHTFRQLAETDDATRRAAIEAAGLTFAPSLVTWGRQARLLADGDEEAFLELTERLVAGRDTGRA